MIQKGRKLALGPSKVLKIPESLKSLYPAQSGKTISKYYFHYEEQGCRLHIDLQITPLKESEYLAYTESIVNIMGCIINVTIDYKDKNFVQIVEIIDSTIKDPIQVYIYDIIIFNIGDVLEIIVGYYKMIFNAPVAIVTQQSSINCYSYSSLTTEINDYAFNVLEYCKSLQIPVTNSNKLFEYNQVVYAALLVTYENFPDIGKYTIIVYNQVSFYYFVYKHDIKSRWIKIRDVKVCQNEIFLNELSYVCAFPDWMHPVKSIINEYAQILEIVKNEALRETEYFSRIYE